MTGGRGGAEDANGYIERLEALTSAMLLAADAGDWGKVGHLDGERRDCIARAGLAGLQLEDLDPILARMRELVAMDGRLRTMAAASRRQALGAVRSARGQMKASAAYDALARQH